MMMDGSLEKTKERVMVEGTKAGVRAGEETVMAAVSNDPYLVPLLHLVLLHAEDTLYRDLFSFTLSRDAVDSESDDDVTVKIE